LASAGCGSFSSSSSSCSSSAWVSAWPVAPAAQEEAAEVESGSGCSAGASVAAAAAASSSSKSWNGELARARCTTERSGVHHGTQRVECRVQRVQRVQRVLRVQRGGACSRVRACAERIESTEVQRSHGVSARGRKVYGGWSTHQQACTPRAILLERCVSHGGVDERARCAVRRAVEGGTAAVKRSQLPRQTRSRVRVMARGPQRACRPARGGVAYRAPIAEREDVLQQGARQREQATARFGVVILADQMTRAGGVNLLGVAAQPWLARECDDAASGRGGRAEAPPSHLELAPSRVGAYRHWVAAFSPHDQ
jgi:hypothetical protein